MTAAWRARHAEPSDEQHALQLLNRAHSGDATGAPSAEEWEWLFLHNPAEAGLQYTVADAGDRLAGQYATLPVRLQIDGARQVGLLSLNTATDPDFQRQGVFTTLAGHLYEAARGSFALVYGFPNARSAPGFFRRLDWQDLGPPPLLIRALRSPGRNFPRRGIGLALAAAAPISLATDLARSSRGVTAVSSFDTWADAIWNRIGPTLGTAAVRDATFLAWRFDAAPRAYRRWTFTEFGERTPQGYAVSRLVPWHGTTLAYLMELSAPTSAAAGALLGAVLRDARDSGAAAICTAATRRHPHRQVLLRHAFVPVPLRLIQNVSFGVRILTDGVPAHAVLSRDAWHLTPADFDWV